MFKFSLEVMVAVGDIQVLYWMWNSLKVKVIANQVLKYYTTECEIVMS